MTREKAGLTVEQIAVALRAKMGNVTEEATGVASGGQPEQGGSSPTPPLHFETVRAED